MKGELGVIVSGIAQIAAPRTELNVKIVTEAEYFRRRKDLQEELRGQYRSAAKLNGSGMETASLAYRERFDKEFAMLQAEKGESDRAYELELVDINDRYDMAITDKHTDHRRRGVGFAGFAQKDIDDINSRRGRDIEKLKMKYGKNLTYMPTEDTSGSITII